MSYYSKVQRDLASATAKQIITQEQQVALEEHFLQNRGFFARLTLVHWLGAAGGVFIALGIILIIAFNWAQLGNFIKIAGYLLMLAGTAWGFVKTENRPALHNFLGVIWFILPAAGIGLIAQIFQLSGAPIKPYLAWAILSAPLALWGGSRLYSRMLCVLLFGILFFGTFEKTSVFCLIFDEQAIKAAGQIVNMTSKVPGGQAAADAIQSSVASTMALKMLGHWISSLALLAAALGINFYKKDHFSTAITAMLVWIIMLLCVPHNALYTDYAEINLAAGISAALLLAFYKMKFCSLEGVNVSSLHNNGTRIWAIILYIISFMHGNSPHIRGEYRHIPGGEHFLGIAVALAIIAAAAWFISREEILKENKEASMMLKTVIIASIAVPFIPAIIGAKTLNTAGIAANIILVAAGIAMLYAGSICGHKKTMNRGMLLIVIIAVTRFLDLFKSQLTSGMAFLITGGLFAFMAWWFSRGADKIAEISSARKECAAQGDKNEQN